MSPRMPWRYYEPWTAEEETILILRAENWRLERIAAKLGRTSWGIRAKMGRLRSGPTQGALLTTTEVAEIMGVSVQYVARLARKRRLKARRVPGGRNWLYPPEQFG